MPVGLTIKSMKQRKVIVVLFRLFPAITHPEAKIFVWKGTVWRHPLPNAQPRGTHLFLLKEQAQIAQLCHLPLKIFLHKHSREQWGRNVPMETGSKAWSRGSKQKLLGARSWFGDQLIPLQKLLRSKFIPIPAASKWNLCLCCSHSIFELNQSFLRLE